MIQTASEVFGGVIRIQDSVSGVLKQAARESKSFSAEVKKARSSLEALDRQKLKEKELRIRNSAAYKAIEGVRNRLKPIRDRVVQLKAREEHALAGIRKVKAALSGVKETKSLTLWPTGQQAWQRQPGRLPL